VARELLWVEGLRLDFNLWKRQSGFDFQAGRGYLVLTSLSFRTLSVMRVVFKGVFLSAFSESWPS
jgi:hypothetical protein